MTDTAPHFSNTISRKIARCWDVGITDPWQICQQTGLSADVVRAYVYSHPDLPPGHRLQPIARLPGTGGIAAANRAVVRVDLSLVAYCESGTIADLEEARHHAAQLVRAIDAELADPAPWARAQPHQQAG